MDEPHYLEAVALNEGRMLLEESDSSYENWGFFKPSEALFTNMG